MNFLLRIGSCCFFLSELVTQLYYELISRLLICCLLNKTFSKAFQQVWKKKKKFTFIGCPLWPFCDLNKSLLVRWVPIFLTILFISTLTQQGEIWESYLSHICIFKSMIFKKKAQTSAVVLAQWNLVYQIFRRKCKENFQYYHSRISSLYLWTVHLQYEDSSAHMCTDSLTQTSSC